MTNSVIENYQEVVDEEQEKNNNNKKKKNTFSFLSSRFFPGVGIPSSELLELIEMREIIQMAVLAV